MSAKKSQKAVVLLTLALALALLASCSRQVTKPLEERDLNPKKASKVADDRSSGKTSAGVTINGNPEKIELLLGSKQLVFKPGEEAYDKITRVCERIVLRVGETAEGSPVSNTDYSRMIGTSHAVVRLVYQKEPVFTFLGTVDRIKQNRKLAGAKGLNYVTFFVPQSELSLKPGTIYDGFYYGNIHMVSTLTNTDLLELVKGLQ